MKLRIKKEKPLLVDFTPVTETVRKNYNLLIGKIFLLIFGMFLLAIMLNKLAPSIINNQTSHQSVFNFSLLALNLTIILLLAWLIRSGLKGYSRLARIGYAAYLLESN